MRQKFINYLNISFTNSLMMKKYFLIMAAFAASALMVSCEPKDTPPPPPPPATEDEATLDSAVYYGEMLGDGAGVFSVTLAQNNNKLKFDFLSIPISDLTKIKPQSGTYTLAAASDLKKGTYFVATDVDDEHGTIYYENGTPILITGGAVKVTVASGGCTISANLKAGDKEIVMNFNGQTIKFDQNLIVPPIKIVADNVSIGYIGEYYEADGLGLVNVVLERKEFNEEYLTVQMTIPLPKSIDEIDKLTIPVGTFNVEASPKTAGKIVPGVYEKGSKYSWFNTIKYINGMASFNGGTSITSGSLTITKNGDLYSITADFKGSKYSMMGDKLGEVPSITYSLAEPMELPEFIYDTTTPMSSLTGDLNLTNLTKIYVDNPWSLDDPKNPVNVLWRIILSSEDISFSLNPEDDSEIWIGGEKGDMIGVQIAAKASTTIPFANYPMGKDLSVGKAVPAGSVNPDMAPGNGIWYLQFDKDEKNELVSVGGAGAMASKGFVNLTAVDNETITVAVEVYDRKGYKITGSVTAKFAELVINTRSMSQRYVPVSDFIDTFRFGSTLEMR